MRVVLVSRDAPSDTGVLLRGPGSPLPDSEIILKESKDVARTLLHGSGKKKREEFERWVCEIEAAGIFARAAPMRVLERTKAIATVILTNTINDLDASFAYRLGYARGMRAPPRSGFRDPEQRVIPVADTNTASTVERMSLTCNGPQFLPSSPALSSQMTFGLLNDEQIRAVLSADGGKSRIHLVQLDVARRHLRRLGGGVIEEGAFLLHPKRDDVLVPLRTYHHNLLSEATREVRVVLGRIGARSLVIETVEGVSFSGKIISRVPTRSGSARVSREREEKRRVTYKWGSPTYDPHEALEDCVWIRDNAGIMTIVDQRRTSDLTRYEEYSKVDTSFSVGLDFMRIFEGQFQWASTSTYRYDVEFFERSAV